MSLPESKSFNKVVYTSREVMSAGLRKNLGVLYKEIEQRLTNGGSREYLVIRQKKINEACHIVGTQPVPSKLAREPLSWT